MTTGNFQYLDVKSVVPNEKPWTKVDGPGYSFRLQSHPRPVTNLRTHPEFSQFSTDNSGFSVHHSPSKVTAADFDNDKTVRTTYYDEVAKVLREHLPSGDKVSHIEIFDHTIRKHDPTSPRQPVQQVHIDQTPRSLPDHQRMASYQHPASDFPLAVIDWRTTSPKDLVKVDLMYPKRPASTVSKDSSDASNPPSDDDDRGKEALPDPSSISSTVGYEPRGETLTVAPNSNHQFYYVKDMTPEETMFIKCFDSRSEWINDEGYVSGSENASEDAKKFGGFGSGKKGIAMGTPHTAFVDPETPVGVKGRESIEVRCLVFYDD
ncbi:uncharacterized protein AB675_10349 [Cyphellophora attinorum]|uniref:Uncharacterized protein n=1 Tax=Cyphellophora attinorum TaxID=1664694 RepID=A0A0N1H0K0_9EURO|nr:uncharacterized protein AB675_10349 [Phialophora attinorum]KPI37422.1 hypothetical protein AB675_10349 [Phialophora attinorum]